MLKFFLFQQKIVCKGTMGKAFANSLFAVKLTLLQRIKREVLHRFHNQATIK